MKASFIIFFCALVGPCVSGKSLRFLSLGTPAPTDSSGVDVGVDVNVPANTQCFSEIATVDVLGKGSVEMKSLEIGDRILTASGSYDTVYAFGHYHETSPTKFLRITTIGNRQPLEVTTEHMVFVGDKKHPVRADSINVGDIVQGQNGEAPVTKIDTITRNGRYAPLTKEATLMVDEIKASSYVALQSDNEEYVALPLLGISTHWSHQNYVHWTLAPYRVLCGVSASLCHSYTADGLPHYIDFGIAAHRWAHGYGGIVEVVFLFFALVLFVICRLMELAMGAPLVALGVTATLVYIKSCRAETTKTVSGDKMTERLLDEGDTLS